MRLSGDKEACMLRRLAISALALLLPTVLVGQDLASLRVLFVTDDTIPGRTTAFTTWLKPLVREVSTVTFNRTHVPPSDALAGWDVVMLDWNQRSHDDGTSDPWPEQVARCANPLGRREAWSTPTVLVGSAGMLVAYTWAVVGDRGCTCLEPMAYDLRDHPIAQGPLPINRRATTAIPTPDAFTSDVKDPTITVLPLVDHAMKDEERPYGWCTYLNTLQRMPDVEWISGGVNHKTIGAGAIWRQGNLLHFGFQQSPADLNETGRNLLANAVLYIAGFHQDRPIGTQLLGVKGQAELASREGIARLLRLRNDHGTYYDWLLNMLAPDERATVLALAHDAAGYERWVTQRVPYLVPSHGRSVLAVDPQLLEAKAPYDSPAFLTLVQDLLRSDHPERAARLLADYMPECPATLPPKEQADWIQQRVPVLFAEDHCDYRWYVDHLALDRHLSSSACRGPARRDQTSAVCNPAGGACTIP